MTIDIQRLTTAMLKDTLTMGKGPCPDGCTISLEPAKNGTLCWWSEVDPLLVELERLRGVAGKLELCEFHLGLASDIEMCEYRDRAAKAAAKEQQP